MLSGRSVAGYIITDENGKLGGDDELSMFIRHEDKAKTMLASMIGRYEDSNLELREALLIITRPEDKDGSSA